MEKKKRSYEFEKVSSSLRRKFPLGILALTLFSIALPAHANLIDDLQEKITGHSSKIQDLQKEIDQYQKELTNVSQQKQTLETTIKTLDVSRKKISTDISLTENKIGSTDAQIQELGIKIGDSERRINQDREGVAAALRDINTLESDSLIENILTYENLAAVWDSIGAMEQFQTSLRSNVDQLSQLKLELEDQKATTENKKAELSTFKKDLSQKKQSLDINKKEKDQLLAVTKNKESAYKTLIEEKTALRKQFEQQLHDYESQLKIAIDPTRLPPVGAGVLSWPVDNVIITQKFGYTAFAASGAYNGQGHNGVDFGAPVGTPVKAAAAGVVQGIGDTDTVCPNASYGKWILIKHNNGLSSLYGHLSRFAATVGQTVESGDVVAYSGNTGYSTGPHVHMTVYATQGVLIKQIPSKVCAGIYTVPIADPKAYLDPLKYL